MQMIYKRTLVVLGVLLISGCAQTQTNTTAQSPVKFNTPSTALPTEVSNRLSEQSGYILIQTDETHWGSQIELDVSPVYYSASGRLCRDVSVTQQGTLRNEQVIACQYGNAWGVTRNVTQALGSATR